MRRLPLFAAALLTFACTDDLEPAACGPNTVKGADGACHSRCLSDDECLLSETCLAQVCSAFEPNALSIRLFEPRPATVPRRGMVELDFVTVGATNIQILERRGNAEPTTIFESATELAGTFEYGPVLEEADVTLVALNGATRVESRRHVWVEDTAGDVAIVSFGANPMQVAEDETFELAWVVDNATGIEIFDGADRIHQSSEPNGIVRAAIKATTTFTLTASGQGGPVTREVTVTVRDGGGPVIDQFDILPRVVMEGDNAVVEWRAQGGSSVELSDPAGEVLFSSASADDALKGLWLVVPEVGARDYSLGVSGPGGAAQEKATVTATARPRAPVIRQLQATPDVLPETAQMATVVVSWDVVGTAARVMLSNGNMSSSQAANGTLTESVNTRETVRYTLRADTEGGIAERTVVVWSQESEFEPNDDPLFANPMEDRAKRGNVGRGPAGPDQDWFGQEVPADGTLRARVLGACQGGLRLELHEPNNMTVLASGNSGAGVCPSLAVNRLPAGHYLVRVSFDANGGVGDSVAYMLIAEGVGPVCGDGVSNLGEGCDDGNREHGDGCSAECRPEPQLLYQIVERPNFMLPEAPDEAVRLTPRLRNVASPRTADDEGIAIVRIGFPFPFFGRTYHGLVVHTNGYVSFLPDFVDDPGFDPHAPVGTKAPNAIIAPFAADLRLAPAIGPLDEGEILVWPGTIPGGNGRIFSVELRNFTFVGAGAARLSARIVLRENGSAYLAYGPVVGTPDESLTFRAGAEDPTGQRWIPLPACPEEGCSARINLENRIFELTSGAVSPGGLGG